MHIPSIAKAVAASAACTGLAVFIGSAALASDSPYRELLIVGGIDAFTIGVAAFILVILFFNKEPAPSVEADPLMRSLEDPQGRELKRMLVRHVSRARPVTIGFPADDHEAQHFAGQIGRFLNKNKFEVSGFAPEPPTQGLDPGIGIDERNHILVGPIRAPASPRPTMESSLPTVPAANDQFRPEIRALREVSERVELNLG